MTTTQAQSNSYRKIPLDNNGNLIVSNFRMRSPSNLVVISYPKMGKTLSMVNVKKILIGDTHKEVDDFPYCNNYVKLTNYTGKQKFHCISSGAYIPAGIFETVVDLKRANMMDEYNKLKDLLEERLPDSEKEKIFEDLHALVNAMPFPIFATDTVTHLQDINLPAALAVYNSQVSPDKQKNDIRRTDQWGGVRHIRNNFSAIKKFIENNAAPFLIWTSHVKERKKIYEKAFEDVGAVDMALEGIMSSTFTAAAAAVGILYRKRDGVYLDFKKRDETDLGSRCPHLSNQVIKIADPQTDVEAPPVTHWQAIYPEISFI